MSVATNLAFGTIFEKKDLLTYVKIILGLSQ
jgi:hypothetical protein